MLGLSAANGGSLTISGQGQDFWGGTQNGEFLYAPVSTTQNFDVDVHIASMSGYNDGWSRAGIMVRQNALPTTACNEVLADDSGQNGPHLETDVNGNASNAGGGVGPSLNSLTPGTGLWVRMTYNASTQIFTEYASATSAAQQPTSWTLEYSSNVPMTGSTMLLGIEESSHSGGNNAAALQTVSYDNLGTLLPYLLTTASYNGLVVNGSSTIDASQLQNPSRSSPR